MSYSPPREARVLLVAARGGRVLVTWHNSGYCVFIVPGSAYHQRLVNETGELAQRHKYAAHTV